MKTASSTVKDELMTLMYQFLRRLKKHTGNSSDALNPYQLHAMFLLSQHSLTMSELAEELDISHPSATSLVDRLVRHGCVERGFDERDRRVIRLELTGVGRSRLELMRAERYKAMKKALDILPASDIAELHRIFSKLEQSLEKHKPTED